MRSTLGTPIELVAINRRSDSLWREKWEVVVGHGDECVHSTSHHDLPDALAMIRILAAGQERDAVS
jgi:hypothetical protein